MTLLHMELKGRRNAHDVGRSQKLSQDDRSICSHNKIHKHSSLSVIPYLINLHLYKKIHLLPRVDNSAPWDQQQQQFNNLHTTLT